MQNKGFSLVGVMVGLGLAGILAVIISQLVARGTQGAKSAELRQDLETIKMTLRSRIDCGRTLNVGPATALPVTCPATLVLRNRNGTELAPGRKIGVWTISARCSGYEILIGATKVGKDPLTGKSWGSKKSATDLFTGTSDFCREYLDPGFTSCAAPYPVFQGRSSEGPTCCRRVTHLSDTTLPYRAIASCAASEYLRFGGGACHYADTGTTPPTGAEPFMHTNYGDYANSRWIADCDQTNIAGDIPAMAFAICCPRN